MSEYSVLKFGGTSAAQPERCAEIFLRDPVRNRLAVMSGVGKDLNVPDDKKVTDWLIELENAVKKGDLASIAEAKDAVIEKTRRAYDVLGSFALNKMENEASSLMSPSNADNGYRWIGERLSARLFSELTGAVYIPSPLRFRHNGRLNLRKSLDVAGRLTEPQLGNGKQVVVEGYFGYDNKSGKVVTLPRGGSDTSGVLYTGALQDMGDEWVNENYTDKNGILSADPLIVPDAQLISELTHEEAREKMHGASERNGVVHGDAIAYAARLGVKMHVLNTFNLNSTGTKIVESRESHPEQPVIGISGHSNLTAISIFDMGMADAENYLADILAEVGSNGISVSNIPTGEDRFKLIFNSEVSDEKLLHLKNIIQKRSISGSEKCVVDIEKNQGSVYIIGQELTKPNTYTRVLARVATTMAFEGLAIKEVISHESSPSLALTVDGPEVQDTIRLLHEKLIESH